MKRLLYILSLTLVLVSCGTRSDRFKIEGRFLNLNQGEVYVYSPDMVITGVDTIKINGGRFSHELPCPKEGTLILVFPYNFLLGLLAKAAARLEREDDEEAA